jgi:tRNA G18 (ribose-2'-O)-methylase SpoU/DNA-binding XRE family transcriptional regulator
VKPLTTADLRAQKPDRESFVALPRNPFAVVCHDLTRGFNVGSIFRLADPFLAERLYLCGSPPTPPRARITKASMGTERWVPWEHREDAMATVAALKADGTQIVAVELTDESVLPDAAAYRPPLALVLGDEMLSVSPAIVEQADLAVAVPMLGMGNSMSVVTAFAIVGYEITRTLRFSLDAERVPGQLQLLRRRRGWSMRELAYRSGVRYTTISGIENRHHRPAPDTMRKLLGVLLPGTPGSYP